MHLPTDDQAVKIWRNTALSNAGFSIGWLDDVVFPPMTGAFAINLATPRTAISVRKEKMWTTSSLPAQELGKFGPTSSPRIDAASTTLLIFG